MTNQSMLQFALKYLAAGFNVLPIKPREKIPAIEWERFHTQRQTVEEVTRWWTQWPDYNIGIITGEISGLTVVDVDINKGGDKVLADLHLPPTKMVKTGSGGWHYYYRFCPSIGNKVGIYTGIDIRNSGGQVVAPPSIHASGRRYRWEMVDEELAEFPIDLFQVENLKKRDWSGILGNGVGQGNRNDAAAAVCGKLLPLFRPEMWEATVWPLVLGWNLKNCPPLPEREMRATFESIVKLELTRNPSRYDKLDTNPVKETIEFTDVTKYKDEIKRELKGEKKFFTWGDRALDTKMPLLEKKSYVIFFGQLKSGKTTYAMHMAKRNAESFSNVCFLSLEMDKKTLARQYAFAKCGITKERYKNGEGDEAGIDKALDDLQKIKFVGLEEGASRKSYNLETIEKIIQERRPDILFIDNLNKIVGGGKSELEITASVSDGLLGLTRRYSTAIVVLHHANKPPDKTRSPDNLRGLHGLRGTNKTADDADIIVELARPNFENTIVVQDNVSTIAVYKDRNFNTTAKFNVYFYKGGFYDEQTFNQKVLSDNGLENIQF